jgi:hypothetical protein
MPKFQVTGQRKRWESLTVEIEANDPSAARDEFLRRKSNGELEEDEVGVCWDLNEVADDDFIVMVHDEAGDNFLPT